MRPYGPNYGWKCIFASNYTESQLLGWWCQHAIFSHVVPARHDITVGAKFSARVTVFLCRARTVSNFAVSNNGARLGPDENDPGSHRVMWTGQVGARGTHQIAFEFNPWNYQLEFEANCSTFYCQTEGVVHIGTWDNAKLDEFILNINVLYIQMGWNYVTHLNKCIKLFWISVFQSDIIKFI